MDSNKLAILANALGGYDEIENLLGIDSELAQRAVEGGLLSGFENAQLETAYNQLYLDPNLAIENNIDLNEIDTLADQLSWTRRYIDDTDYANVFRKSVADGIVSLEDVENGGGLFANLTMFQMQKTLDVIQDDPEKTRAMFEAYYNDAERGQFNNVKESMFWAWFREIFYSD